MEHSQSQNLKLNKIKTTYQNNLCYKKKPKQPEHYRNLPAKSGEEDVRDICVPINIYIYECVCVCVCVRVCVHVRARACVALNE